MRKVKIAAEVLSRAGRYREDTPEDPGPKRSELKFRFLWEDGSIRDLGELRFHNVHLIRFMISTIQAYFCQQLQIGL